MAVSHSTDEKMATPEATFFDPAYSRGAHSALQGVLESGFCGGLSAEVDRAEALLSSTFGCHCACVSNGTVALELALRAAGVHAGDRIAVPARSFVATANAVIMVGATPVFIGLEADGISMCPKMLTQALQKHRRIRGVIAAHLYGLPANISELTNICQAHNVPLVEDVAQSIGARHRGRLLGTFGEAATLSFFSNKIIACGEGGAVLARSKSAHRSHRLLRYHGAEPGPNGLLSERRPGTNARLNALSAALLNTQLVQLPELLEKRQIVWDTYRTVASELRLPLALMDARAGDTPVRWVAALRPKGQSRFAVRRLNLLIAQLAARGIAARPGMPNLARLPFFRAYPLVGTLKSCLSNELLLPVHPAMTSISVMRVLQDLSRAVRSA